MMNLPYFLNSGWMWKCAPEAHAFRRATNDVKETQANLLSKLLKRNQQSSFGQQYRFAQIRSAADFQDRIPLATYDSISGWIERIAGGEANVLTTDRVELLEPTGGSSGGEKLIPYTRSLRREFQRGVAVWIHDLFRALPAIRHGRAYWSVTPAMARRTTAGGIRIGFDDDTAYLGGLERRFMDSLLAVPSDVARTSDVSQFRYATLRYLLSAADLTLISIWNPRFLTSLLTDLQRWEAQLCDDIGKVDRRRGRQLQTIFAHSTDRSAQLARIWPQLGLISCWTDAAAALAVPELRELFPRVAIQPKGLLATEGFASLPLVGKPGAVLAVRSHFFEFQEMDGNGKPTACCLAHQLEPGGRYRVVLTTGGGLYRYQLHDEVEVIGFEHRCPRVRFLGRSDAHCDLVGEKLSEAHVRQAISDALAGCCFAARFSLLVPVPSSPPRYRLYLESLDDPPPRAIASRIATDLQHRLENNPQYKYACQLRQLAPVEVRVGDGGGETLSTVYERRCVERGQKLGDIKPRSLDAWTGWIDLFEQPEGAPL